MASFRHILYMEMHIFEEASEMFVSHLRHRTPDELCVTQCIVFNKWNRWNHVNKPCIRMWNTIFDARYGCLLITYVDNTSIAQSGSKRCCYVILSILCLIYKNSMGNVDQTDSPEQRNNCQNQFLLTINSLTPSNDLKSKFEIISFRLLQEKEFLPRW